MSIFISILMITYLLGETDLSPIVWRINWWIHSLIILAFLFLIPRSKHLHLVLAPINIFFKPFDLPDHTPVNIDLEGSEDELDAMLADLTEMTKNQALDVSIAKKLEWYLKCNPTADGFLAYKKNDGLRYDWRLV